MLFQPDTTLPLRLVLVIDEWLEKGRVVVGNGTGVSNRDVLIVGTDSLPLVGKEVLFQLGIELLPGVVSNEDDWPGSDNVGKGVNVPLGILTVGTELLPPEVDVVLFHPENTLLVVDDPGSVVSGVVGSIPLEEGTDVSLERLRVGTVPLPLEAVLFQPETVLPVGRTPELVSPEVVGNDKVGKGVSGPLDTLIVGTETLPPGGEVVLFQPGPLLRLEGLGIVVIGVVDNGALGKGSPVPEILIL